MNTRLSAALATVAIAASVAIAQTPLGTAFTYQGQLKSGGSPAGGSFNMVFKLFDAATVGNQVGPTLTFDGVGGDPAPVTVTNGLFTVQLDFGLVFTGNKRWLEIAVSGTTLSPRQELTAAPYARFSSAPWASSGTAISNTNGGNVGIGTTTPATSLHIVDPSVAQLKLDRTGGAALLLQAGTTVTRVGSTTSTRLGFLIGGNDQMTLDTAGNLGIGTAVPAERLHVVGNAQVDGTIKIPATTRYLSISPLLFVNALVATQVPQCFDDNNVGLVAFGSELGFIWSAPVQLPDGATVTEFRATADDNATDVNLNISLRRCPLTSGPPTVMASVTIISSSATPVTTTDTSIASAVIDNSQFMYWVEVNWPTSGQSNRNVDLYGIRIKYTVTSPLP